MVLGVNFKGDTSVMHAALHKWTQERVQNVEQNMTSKVSPSSALWSWATSEWCSHRPRCWAWQGRQVRPLGFLAWFLKLSSAAMKYNVNGLFHPLVQRLSFVNCCGKIYIDARQMGFIPNTCYGHCCFWNCTVQRERSVALQASLKTCFGIRFGLL